MPDNRESVEIVVSVQATGAEGAPWDGHLAAGVLAAEDTVVVPDPPVALLDAARGFEALVVPTSLTADAPIERIQVRGIEAMRVADTDRVTSMILQLAYRSRYRPMMSPFEGYRLNAELREHDDLWTALENVGAIRTGLRDAPTELLRAVPEFELAQRQSRIRFHLYREPGDNSFNICDYVRWCNPVDPRRQSLVRRLV